MESPRSKPASRSRCPIPSSARAGEGAAQPRAQTIASGGPVVPSTPVPAVLIGIVDVGGFDFAHPDFLTPDGDDPLRQHLGSGRAQGLAARTAAAAVRLTAPKSPRERMNRALEWSRTHKVGATDLLRQSSQRPGAHGTHVASIAAGNAASARTPRSPAS